MTMTSKWCRDKQAVVVVVYAEKPRGRSGSGGDGRRHQQQQRRVRVLRGNNININVNRRGELLEYARHLREPQSHIKQPISTTQVSSDDRRRNQKHASRSYPTCFDKWSCFAVTRFLRSAKDNGKEKTNRKKKAKMKKALVKPPLVQKKESFISKLLAALQKRRSKN